VRLFLAAALLLININIMQNPTAAIIIIGDEVLSGRTLDTNTQYIAKKLSEIGVDLIEARVIPDNRQMIIDTIYELKTKYTYIFTTGGIGPTHDDITSEAVAAAFNLPLELHKESFEALKESYASRNQVLNKAREKMAYIPKDAALIPNPISIAPGFRLDNVYVMAGVPYIMEAMLNQILPLLKHGKQVKSKTIDVIIGESLIAADLESIQNKYPEIKIGSYPFKLESQYCTSVVLRSSNYEKLDQAYTELLKLFENYSQVS
jgi:molybdenum cofactor synthesis domain-containing protein